MKLNSEDKLLLGFLFSRVYNPPFLTRAVFKEKPRVGRLGTVLAKGSTRTESLETTASPFFDKDY